MVDVRQSLRDYIAREFLDGRPGFALDDDTPLVEEGILDSMGIFLLIGFVESDLGVTIEPEDVVLEHFETIAVIARLVETRRPGATPG